MTQTAGSFLGLYLMFLQVSLRNKKFWRDQFMYMYDRECFFEYSYSNIQIDGFVQDCSNNMFIL